MTNSKSYCPHCGQVQEPEATVCPYCHKALDEKEHLFREYLINHTKDKLKGSAEDKLYDLIKNFLVSHLYGVVVTITLAATVVSAAAAHPAPRAKKMPQRPAYVSSVPLAENPSSPAASEQTPAESSAPEETEETAPVQETIPTPTYDLETQADVILANYPLWETPVDYAMSQIYFVTDMDLDGLLEINCLTTMGTGFFTARAAYEVNETMDGVVPVWTPTDSDPDYFVSLEPGYDGTEGTFLGYYHPSTNTCSYIVSDLWRAGAASHGRMYMALTMENNSCHLTPLGFYTWNSDINGENVTEEYQVDGQSYDSEEAWRAAMAAKFDGCLQFTYTANTLSSYDITDLDSQIRQLIETYQLTMKQAD